MEILRRIPKTISFILLGTLISLGLFFTLMYFLGYFLGTLTFLLLLFLSSLGLSNFFIFPGSYKLWRYWWQISLECELANNFIDHLHELKYVLELLEKSSNLIHIKKNYKQLQESLDIFKVLLSSYNNIQVRELTKDQIAFRDKLSIIMKQMSELYLIFPNKSEDLMSAFEHTQDFDWENMTFEDFPENLALKSLTDSFEDLESFAVKFTIPRFPWSYTQEGLFTNLNILRLILQASVKCEQYWISAESYEIDCILVKNEENTTDAPVMIYCNPNGGLYEYACYQNNWLEFYLALGIDFCMWNYRGYGRTKGRPSLVGINNDVQAVYNFLSKVKMYQKIGVHGESIGAVPACELASKAELQFLIADRTFGSLSQLVQSRLRIPKGIFNCLTRWDDKTSQKFLAVGSYKILSCDTEDQLIVSEASLKSCVAQMLGCNELDKESLNEFLEGIKNISVYVKAIHAGENLTVDGSKESNDFREIEVSGENLSVLGGKIYGCLEIDAGGVSLFGVTDVEALRLWIRVLQIWGSFLPIGSNAMGKEKAVQRVKAAIDTLTLVFRENEFVVNPNIVSLCRQARLLKNGFSKILKCLENFNRVNTEELTIREEDAPELSQSGFLLPVTCGHSGKFSEEERNLLAFHLKQSKFIN